jgi:GH15 family glucan-1,4-alpha-glucosidase
MVSPQPAFTNFPQAFTHLALIDVARRLIEAEHAPT